MLHDLNANITASLGRMRCLKALGEWERLYKLATDSFSDIRLELDRLNNSNRLHKMLNYNNNVTTPPSEDELSSHSLNSETDRGLNGPRQRSGFNKKWLEYNKKKECITKD